MNKILKVATFVVLFIFPLASCNQGGGSEIEVEYLWSMDDIKNAEKLANETSGIFLSYDNTVFVKPPFYSGEMPLRFIATGKQRGGGGMMSSFSGVAFVYDFGSWLNYFIYRDSDSIIHGIPDGAIAVDVKTKNLIAECKILEMLNKGNHLTGFRAVENHFNMEGKAIFSSVFEIDFSDGFKVREIQTKGKKKGEYFFVWPNGMGGPF